MSEAGTLPEGVPHPAAEIARRYIMESGADLLMIQESLASCAIEGNRMAEICSETLRRVINKEPVSDRYFMGLAWMIWSIQQEKNDE